MYLSDSLSSVNESNFLAEEQAGQTSVLPASKAMSPRRRRGSIKHFLQSLKH